MSFLLSFSLISLYSCQSDSIAQEAETDPTLIAEALEESCEARMLEHLQAVSSRDLETLASTLSPTGEMQLTLSGTPITYTAQDFMDYHTEWFAIPGWTFDTEILNMEVGPKYGIVTTEVVYREEERDGEPYFNRMAVGYVLRLEDGEWYVIKDQAVSLEKSTD